MYELISVLIKSFYFFQYTVYCMVSEVRDVVLCYR